MRPLLVAAMLPLLALSAAPATATEQTVPIKLQGSYNEGEQILFWPPVHMAPYEDRVYGFTFYSTTTDSSNVVHGKIMSYFTNGHRFDGDTICLSHRWLNGNNEVVFSGDIKIGLEPRTKRRIDIPFEMPLEWLQSVETWHSDYYNCDSVPDVLIGKAVCNATAYAAAYFLGTPTEAKAVCEYM